MISDELKDIVEKIKTQGHMEFMEGATKNKFLNLRERMK